MIIKGTLEKVSTTGYQHFMTVKTAEGEFVFRYLDPDLEIDADAYEKFPVGQEVSFPVFLGYTISFEVAEAGEPLRLSQPQGKATAVGIVKEKHDPYHYLLDIGNGDTLPVNFERMVDLHIGQKIKVVGALDVDESEE
jgi:hypothetical protein